jgi:hypothetical protein
MYLRNDVSPLIKLVFFVLHLLSFHLARTNVGECGTEFADVRITTGLRFILAQLPLKNARLCETLGERLGETLGETLCEAHKALHSAAKFFLRDLISAVHRKP